MKKPKKNDRGPYLQKSNNRWQWMAGATAATAAGVTASHASLVTINLSDNYISATGGNHLNADLTGDGHPDLTIAGASYSRHFSRDQSGYISNVRVGLNGVYAGAGYDTYDIIGFVALGSKSERFYQSSGARTVTGSIPIFFKDLHINAGAPTRGSLDVTVSSIGSRPGGTATVQLDSVSYNAPGGGSRLGLSVPDQGSSLGLLAMGAGGVLALRRWRATQARSYRCSENRNHRQPHENT
jgi:hypothetical protein